MRWWPGCSKSSMKWEITAVGIFLFPEKFDALKNTSGGYKQFHHTSHYNRMTCARISTFVKIKTIFRFV